MREKILKVAGVIGFLLLALFIYAADGVGGWRP